MTTYCVGHLDSMSFVVT